METSDGMADYMPCWMPRPYAIHSLIMIGWFPEPGSWNQVALSHLKYHMTTEVIDQMLIAYADAATRLYQPNSQSIIMECYNKFSTEIVTWNA
jgi:hypothetical protein